MKKTVIAAILFAASSAAFAGPPYVFDLELYSQDSKPAGERNLCAYAAKYNNGAQYLVVINAPTTTDSCPKRIRWTEKGTQIGTGTECQYNMSNGTMAIAGYVDKRSNSCWSESLVEWF